MVLVKDKITDVVGDIENVLAMETVDPHAAFSDEVWEVTVSAILCSFSEMKNFGR